MVTLPVHLTPDVEIFISGTNVVVTTGFGLIVKFDGSHRVQVKIPEKYSGKVCGICGNFNGNAPDDFLNPDGQLESDSTNLGNSWQVDNDTRYNFNIDYALIKAENAFQLQMFHILHMKTLTQQLCMFITDVHQDLTFNQIVPMMKKTLLQTTASVD